MNGFQWAAQNLNLAHLGMTNEEYIEAVVKEEMQREEARRLDELGKRLAPPKIGPDGSFMS